ncbi:MAG: hemc: hydroxymethylbilane synthase [Verrucomicrobiales bacterium]|nr:hemc: hydroxymethylbilane synthase [Verrucomicrobiales bacterium]
MLLTLGTRGSELALAQTVLTTAALNAAHPDLTVRREIIKTSGDLRPDLKLSDFSKGDSPILDKGIFTKELENALRAGTIHTAVHSLKDVPTFLDPGFKISAVLPRAPIEDILISKIPGGLDALPPGSTVATSSVRRVRLLKHLRPDLNTVEIRGNVPTRIRKVAEDPAIDALILARAGLHRLGLYHETLTDHPVPLHLTILDPERFLPAASQGAVALETWQETPEIAQILAALNHADTFARITAERHFLELLQAGCQTPVGIHTWITGDLLHLKALVFPDHNDAPPRQAQVAAPLSDPLAAAKLLHDSLA